MAFLVVPLIGCATPASDDPEAVAEFEEVNDPFEPVNRVIFEFNHHFDFFILKPVTIGYRTLIPVFLRDRIHSALLNLRSPVIFANDLFQGEAERAGITLGRFLVNSSLGIAGLFDVAREMGLVYHNEDFGQTLAVWGADEGPYLVLPLFGPSNPRDAAGIVVDIFLDPLNYLLDTDKEFLYARTGLEAVDQRERFIEVVEDLEATSIDLYATFRSLYRQHRGDQIRNGDLPPPLPVPGVSMLEDAPPAQPAQAQALLDPAL